MRRCILTITIMLVLVLTLAACQTKTEDQEKVTFTAMDLLMIAGGPPAEGEDLRYQITIENGEIRVNKYGKEGGWKLSESTMQQIDELFQSESVKDWDGYDVKEEGFDYSSFIFHLVYNDGSTVNAKGYGSTPKNYYRIKNELIRILEIDKKLE